MLRVSPLRRLIPAALLGGAALLASCSSPESRQVREATRSFAQGDVFTAHTLANALLENPGSLTTAQVEELRRMHAQAEQTITEYFASHMQRAMLDDDPNAALEAYEAARQTVPATAALDPVINAQAAKAYAARRENGQAIDAANLVFSSPDADDDQRAAASTMIDSLRTLEEARSKVEKLRPTIEAASAATGTSFDQMPTLGCATSDVLAELPEETREKIREYFEALYVQENLSQALRQNRPL